MASVILGDWTLRRGDAGGARAVRAEIERPRPTVTWAWQPEHGGRVDQVRIAGSTVVVATMAPGDPVAPGWEHAVLYALDADTGAETARRVLPDPVPVAAMVVEAGVVHVIAARRGEPIFGYGLSLTELAARHRRIIWIADGARHEDVLDAWATPDGGMWLELDGSTSGESARFQAYAFADPAGAPFAVRLNEDRPSVEGPLLAHDACAGGDDLFVPVDGRWREGNGSAPPSISRLDRLGANACKPEWARATLVGPHSQIHALGGEGMVCAVAIAEDVAKPDRAHVEAFAADCASGVVKWRAYDDRMTIRPQFGDAARVARRPNGELLLQSLDRDGAPCTPLICAKSDGRIDAILLGAGRYVLDAALGDLVLAHRESKDGRVEIVGFAIDQEGRVLGRRATARWTIDAGDVGSGTTVYAGAGRVIVRGDRALRAIQL